MMATTSPRALWSYPTFGLHPPSCPPDVTDASLVGSCCAIPGRTLSPTSSGPSVSSRGMAMRRKRIRAPSALGLGDGMCLLLRAARRVAYRRAESAQVNRHLRCVHVEADRCLGMHLADASVWISVAMSLAVFDVSKVVENGVEITPEVDPSSGTIR